MAEYKENISTLSIDREMEDRLGQIILACGNCSVKEKVSLLYLSIEFIFEHNKELIPVLCDEASIH